MLFLHLSLNCLVTSITSIFFVMLTRNFIYYSSYLSYLFLQIYGEKKERELMFNIFKINIL